MGVVKLLARVGLLGVVQTLARGAWLCEVSTVTRLVVLGEVDRSARVEWGSSAWGDGLCTGAGARS